MIIIALIEILLATFLSANLFSYSDYNHIIIETTLNNYWKEEFIYYTKSFWSWTWKYCLNKQTFDFSACDFDTFKNNRNFITYVNTDDNILDYKQLSNDKNIIKTTLK